MQEEYFGFNSTRNLKDIIPRLFAKNIFLVTGKNSYKSSGAKKVLNELLKNYNTFHFSDFSANPKLNDVEKGIAFMKEKIFDIIIAVGGGSVIDMAKLINVLVSQDNLPLHYINKKGYISKKGKPLIAIPTTAGSGSEATHFAVVYINKSKYSIAHEYLLPNIAIIDPKLTLSLPPYITASTGMDAFSQAVESYWSINSTEESKGYSREAIKLIVDNLITAVNNPTKQSRANMAKAAFFSGKAINITQTTAPHALSYAITSYFGVSHGQAVSLTLPDFLIYNYELNEKENCDKRGASYVKKAIEDIILMLNCRDVYQAKNKIQRMMHNIGLATKLSKVGINTESDIQNIVDNINIERLRNNPRIITRKGIKELLENQLY